MTRPRWRYMWNPWEWLKFFYENAGHKHPTLSAWGFLIVFAMAGWLVWWRLDAQYKKDHPGDASTAKAATQASEPPAPPPDKPPLANVDTPKSEALASSKKAETGIHVEGSALTNSPIQQGEKNTVIYNPESQPNAGMVTYDFNGTKRITSPGKVSAIGGEELGAFQQMLELEKTEDWSSIATLAESWKKRNPQYLGAYVMLGRAYYKLGRFSEAIDLLEYVIERTPGNPQFAQLPAILEDIHRKADGK
jgi:tetratricopeptide (TPR) repeat protein